MSGKIKKLYIIFIMLSVLVGLIVLNNAYISHHFGYALVGVLLATASIFGLITKSSFLGSAYIVPKKSESLFGSLVNLIINSLTGLAGISLILFNIYKFLI